MALAVGDRIGPYEIATSLGAGGMGEVYRATDTRLGRAVAIKVLNAACGATAAEIERFQREARAIARLNHPNICTLHDVVYWENVPFLVMELVDGTTLAERLERSPVPLDEALAAGAQIARALDAAHGSGVVHRDLKPGNVMLTPNGVKLLDFGLAKLRDGEYGDAVDVSTKSLTHEGTVLGTLPYMAPEQVEGREADARTDIFALGVVLYEMITGGAPFNGDSRASLAGAILTYHPPALTSRAGSIPAILDRVVQKCLAKNPEQRWQSARDVAQALEWGAADAVRDRNASRAAVRQSWRAAAIALAAIAATIGLAALVMWASGWPPAVFSPGSTAGVFHQATYRRGAVSSARFTADGQSFVYSASWENGPWRVYLGRPRNPDVRDLGVDGARIVSISRAGDMAVLMGAQNIVRVLGTPTLTRVPLAGGAHRPLETGIIDADWIPGTETLAAVRNHGRGRPWTVEFPVGTVVHETRAAWSLRVSPDGTRVAFFEGSIYFEQTPTATITVVDRSGRKSTVARNVTGIGLAWAPRGHEIWFTAVTPGRAAQLRATTLAGRERTVMGAADWLVLHDIAADGRVLLSRNTVRNGMSCQPRTGARENDLEWMLSSIVTDLSDDGTTVLFEDHLSGMTQAGNPSMFLRKLDGSAAIPLGEGRSGKLSPDGRWVLVHSGDNYSLLPTGTGSILKLGKGDLGQLLGASWFPDSKRIAFAAIPSGDTRQMGYIQDVPDGTPQPITPRAVNLIPTAAMVRDDHSVLGLAGAEDRWAVYSLNGAAPQVIPGLTGRDIPIQWSPDGRYLYVSPYLRPGVPPPPAFDVFRVEVANGHRTLWKSLQPQNPLGVESINGTFVMTRDGGTYCYSYVRRVGDLFVVEGLK